MSSSSRINARLAEMVRSRNRELALDAALKALLGTGFSAVSFGGIFWMGWIVGIFVGPFLGLHGWQFGGIVAGLFFLVAAWSAWRRVDPLAGLKPLTDAQMLLMLIGQTTGAFTYFSPRHAIAGAAIVLIGGPANVFEAFGIWASRIRADAPLLANAARLLFLCQEQLAIEEVHTPAAAFLLRRLALVKVVPCDDGNALALTD